MNELDTYLHQESCGNCHHQQMFHIPRGKTIDSFMAIQTCSNCGCAMRPPEIKYRMDSSPRVHA